MLLGISFLVYLLLEMAPIDPAMMFIDIEMGPVTPEMISYVRSSMGLDSPFLVRYVIWLGNLLRGNMGFSFLTRMPVTYEVGMRIGMTIRLSVISLTVSMITGVVFGVFSALRQYKVSDYIMTILAFIGISIPSFWLALMLIIFFSNTLGWLPSIGLRDVQLRDPTVWQAFVDRTRHMIMPVIASSLAGIAANMRFMRAAYLDVARQDYIRTARSKGLNETTISMRHALRNASLPIITNLGMTLPALIGGSLIIENIFGLPGMGRLFMTAITVGDYPVVMGITLVTALLIMIGIFLADIAYAIVDPRIRYS